MNAILAPSADKARFAIAIFLALASLTAAAVPVAAQEEKADAVPAISAFTTGMEKHEGFFNFYWDEKNGKVWLEIGNWGEEFIYYSTLPWGVGSNDIGLDRGQLRGEHIVAFHRHGPKVLMIEPNYDYRADGASPEVEHVVEQSFAQSVLWGAQVAAQENGRVLVDAEGLLLRDAHGVVKSLREAGEGEYRLDPSRSAVYMPRTKGFPDNCEFEAILTFAGEAQGEFLRTVTPTKEAVTVHQHHSFVRLPPAGYEPRAFDPRSGAWEVSYSDYAVPFDRPLIKRFIGRHRLEKKDPEAAVSEAVEPVVYYVDPGIPEPVRSAVIEGAGWWSEAFEAAGYKDAWRVEVLPADADPMDIRYNLIQWVHRSTRGWSYGGSVSDPRTGEIIKGHVTLGSLRIRQDYLIAVALTAPYADGDEATAAREMALQRIRQLSAHEVGHSLGFMHNYASNMNDRSSVMDYPHPLVRIGEDGKIDLSDAYTGGIGEWDKVMIAYSYQDFPDGIDENAALKKILGDAFDSGLRFISDSDSRPQGGAHPYSHLWDNGTDPVDELDRVLRIRSAALENFSEANIRSAEPFCTLQEVLVPLFLFHRYQTEAAIKSIGGLDYNYALRGEDQPLLQIVPGDRQRQAIAAVMRTLHPDTLTVPERVIDLIQPRVPGYERGAETFAGRTGVTFDPIGAAESAAGVTLELLLHPERISRMVELHARDTSVPGPEELIDTLLTSTWNRTETDGLRAEVGRMVARLALRGVMALAVDGRASDQARAIALLALEDFRGELKSKSENAGAAAERAHHLAALMELEAFLEDPRPERIPATLTPPPGSPIG